MTDFSTATFVAYIFSAAIQLLIAGIFLQAGLSKLHAANQDYYASTIQSYGIKSKAFALSLVKVIGVIEVVICGLIMIPGTASLGLLFAAGLLAVYLLAFAKQILQGKADMNCGCGGPAADLKISPMLLIRNGTLIGLCLFSMGSQPVPYSMIWQIILPVAAILGLLYCSCEQLIANQQNIQLLGNT